MLSRFFKYRFMNDKTISSLIDCKVAENSFSNEYVDLAQVGYQKNVVVYRCVHLIARATASISWLLKQYDPVRRVDQILHSHPILDLFENPNPRQSRASFIEAAVSHLLLSGNCYIKAVRDDQNAVREFHILRPDRVKVIPGENSLPLGYEYRVRNSKVVIPANADGFSDVLHMKLFNPLSDWYGQSPVSVAINAIRQHNAIAKQNISFLANGGRPSGALIYNATLDGVQKQALRQNIKEAYEGGRNAGKILLLEGILSGKKWGCRQRIWTSQREKRHRLKK